MGQHEMMRAELLLLHPEQGMHEGPAPKVAEIHQMDLQQKIIHFPQIRYR